MEKQQSSAGWVKKMWIEINYKFRNEKDLKNKLKKLFSFKEIKGFHLLFEENDYFKGEVACIRLNIKKPKIIINKLYNLFGNKNLEHFKGGKPYSTNVFKYHSDIFRKNNVKIIHQFLEASTKFYLANHRNFNMNPYKLIHCFLNSLHYDLVEEIEFHSRAILGRVKIRNLTKNMSPKEQIEFGKKLYKKQQKEKGFIKINEVQK